MGYFTGVSAYEACMRVECFSSARRALEACKLTPTGRQRSEKANGYHLGKAAKGVRWVRETRDGSIAFRLYNTDVVVWHKDGSLTITAYPSVTTTQFARRFLPRGLYTTALGLIGFNPKAGWDWSNTTYCRASSPVRMVQTEAGGWEPVMEDLECQPFTWLVTDRKAARKAVEGYDFDGLKGYMRLMTYHNVKIDHIKDDMWASLEALEAGDFRNAAAHLPKMAGKSFGREAKPCCVQNQDAPNLPWHKPDIVTLGSIDRLRQMLYAYNSDVYAKKTALTLPRGKVQSIKTRHATLAKCGERIPYFGG